MPGVVLQSGKAMGQHPIDIQRGVQMIDLMLEDTGIPSRCFNDLRFSLMIETTDANLLCSRNKRSKATQAQATFKERLR